MMNHEEHKAWLASLKVGDEVCVITRYYTHIKKIERTTANYFVVGLERFRRDNGRVTGTHYYSLQPVTEQVREAVELVNLHAWVRSLEVSHRLVVPLKVLRAMKAAYDEHMPKEPQ